MPLVQVLDLLSKLYPARGRRRRRRRRRRRSVRIYSISQDRGLSIR
jgi:hypothetical protein